MRTNWFKYIFFAITIILICVSIYIIYKDGKIDNTITNNKSKEFRIMPDIKIGITEYDTINPILSKNKDIQYISKLIYMPLIDITYAFEAKSGLTKEYSKINNTTYLLKLKDGIVWHDGKKFSSKDVEFTIKGIKNLKEDSIYKSNVENISKIEIIDESTLKIYLNKEQAFFEYMLNIPILASHLYDSETLINKSKVPVGTGIYKISNINDNEIEIVKYNKDTKGYIDKIKIKIYESNTKMYNSFIKEDLDIINITNNDYEKYIGMIGYNTSFAKGREFDYISFNTEDTLLKNVNIRQAINYAIDKNIIIYNIYNNKYNEAKFPLDYGSFLCSNMTNSYNIREAENLLNKEGWKSENGKLKKGNEVLKLNLIVQDDKENRILVAEEIKRQLNEIGIEISITKTNKLQFNTYIKNRNYDLILRGNLVSIMPDLQTYFGENNISNYNNQEINTILEEIKSITNQEVLKSKYLRIIEIYEKEMPFISLYFNNNILLYNPKIKGNMQYNWYNIFYNIESWYKIDE